MRPLGFWIKEIDRRIEAGLTTALAAEELTRRHWQVLDTVARGEDPATELAPFAGTVGPAVDDLTWRGWLADGELTGAGRLGHDRVTGRVREFRARVAAGLSAQEYATLVGLLERVAANLDPADLHPADLHPADLDPADTDPA